MWSGVGGRGSGGVGGSRDAVPDRDVTSTSVNQRETALGSSMMHCQMESRKAEDFRDTRMRRKPMSWTGMLTRLFISTTAPDSTPSLASRHPIPHPSPPTQPHPVLSALLRREDKFSLKISFQSTGFHFWQVFSLITADIAHDDSGKCQILQRRGLGLSFSWQPAKWEYLDRSLLRGGAATSRPLMGVTIPL